MEEGCIVRVIKDFLTTTEGELCINAKEYLQVLERIDRHWLRCRFDQREGKIPSANVTEVEIGKWDDGTRIFVSANDFHGEQQEDLHLKRGTLVIATEKIDESWWKGHTLDGFHGVFPLTYCWELDASNYLKKGGRNSNKKFIEKFAQVLHSMKAQLPEEIDLVEGDVVKVVEIIDKDWYRGEVKGRTGTFPSSFVRIIDSFPGSVPPESANVAPYLDASKHKDNEYMNTKPAFKGLEESLRTMGQQSMLRKVTNGLTLNHDPNVPLEIFEDSYFRQNLPESYGSVSMTPPIDDNAYDIEQSVFGGQTERCSQGFQDLSRNLAALHNHYPRSSKSKSLDYSKLHEGLSCFQYENDSILSSASPKPSLEYYNQIPFEFSLLQTSENEFQFKSVDQYPSYNKLSENLSLFKDFVDQSNNKAVSDDTPTLDYNKISENLNVFHEEKMYQNQNKNVADTLSGYTGDNVNVRPYAITKYNFVPEFDNEIGFSAGEMIYLHRYVDKDWAEGEIDNQKGIFPVHYINVIVDCNDNSSVITEENCDIANKSHTLAELTYANMIQDTYYKVLYTFHAQMEGDITVSEGEVVHIKEKQNGDWVLVENSQSETGVMPINHLDPTPEFDGKAVFDIERLLSYKLKKEQKEALMISMEKNIRKGPKIEELKFFDPLQSPDDEMTKIEQELESKIKQPKVISMPGNKVALNLKAKKEDTTHQSRLFQPKTPKNIESLINTNLSKLRSTSPKGEKVFQDLSVPKEKIPISQMVLLELRGKNNLDMSSKMNDLDPYRPPSVSSLSRESPKRPRKSPAPPRPKVPPLLKKSKPPAPQPPSGMTTPSPSPSRVSCSSQSEEPLYSTVRKNSSSRESLDSRSSSSPPPPSYPPPSPTPIKTSFESFHVPASSRREQDRFRRIRTQLE